MSNISKDPSSPSKIPSAHHHQRFKPRQTPKADKSITSGDYLNEMYNKSSFGNQVIMRHVSDLFLKITINLQILGKFNIVFDVFENCQMGRKYYNMATGNLNNFEFLFFFEIFSLEPSSNSSISCVILMAQKMYFKVFVLLAIICKRCNQFHYF